MSVAAVAASVSLALAGFAVAPASTPHDSAADTAPSSSIVDGADGVAPNPLQLLNGLLASPFPVEVLPESFAASAPEPWLDYNDTDLENAVGGLLVEQAGDDTPSDFSGGLFFIVYGQASAAEQYFAEADMGAGPPRSENFCLEVVGVVLIGAVDGVDDGVHACELTAVAADHLETVTAAATDPPPPLVGELPGPLGALNRLVYDTEGAELVAYDDPRVGTAVGAVELSAADPATTTTVVVLRSDAEADERLLSDPWFAEGIYREENADGDLEITFTTPDGFGCAASRGTIVIVAEVESAEQAAALDTACAAVIDGAEVVGVD